MQNFSGIVVVPFAWSFVVLPRLVESVKQPNPFTQGTQ